MASIVRTDYENASYPGQSRILLSGKAFKADVSGALFWPAEHTLIVSDLDFENDAEPHDQLLSIAPNDSTATLTRLGEVIDRYNPDRVLILGSALCRQEKLDLLSADDKTRLDDLHENRKWVWITDQPQCAAAEKWDDAVHERYDLNGIHFCHKPVRAPIAHEIAGSLKPIAKISQNEQIVRNRCFISNGVRLVMPSFNAYSTGLNVMDDHFQPLFGAGALSVWLVGWTDVTPIAPRQLLLDDV